MAREVTLDPSQRLVTLDGWGTSLAWFAHVVGGWAETDKKAQLMDLLFSPTKGLGLNIVRYNIGGGENPEHTHMHLGMAVPGFQPAPGVWDWDADANQRWVLQEAKHRGANLFEAFANSPPYWMTNSRCAAGAHNGLNNLAPEYDHAFADYLTEVVLHFRDHWGIEFQTLNPLNEPAAPYWTAGGRQEGCYFGRDRQDTILSTVGAMLTERGLSATRLSAPDETSIDDTLASYRAYSAATQRMLAQVNTHSYLGSQRAELRNAVKADGKQLWMSEYGVGKGEHDHDAMDSALALAKAIRLDLMELRPSAWVYWQAVENEIGRSDNWGFIHANFAGPEEFWLTKQYYAMGHHSKFIRPGFDILAVSDDDVLAAYGALERQLVVVITNPRVYEQTYTLALQGVPNSAEIASAHLTSCHARLEALDPIEVRDSSLTISAPPRSIITLVFPNLALSTPSSGGTRLRS